MKLIKIILVTSLSLAVHAEEPRNWQESWYIGGGIGQSTLNPNGGTQWHVSDDKSGAKKLYTGVNITKDTSLEAFWSDFGDAELKNGTQSGDINYKAIGVSGVYKPPISIAGIRPLGKLGIAKFTTKDKGDVSSKQVNNSSLFLGVGAEYELTQNINLRAEFERYDKDIKQYNLGLNWRPLHRNRIHRVERVNIPESTPAPVVVAPKPRYIPPPVVVAPAPRYIPAPVVIKPVVQKPVAPKPVIQVIHSSLSGGSNFNTGSSQLTSIGMGELRKLARDLQAEGMKVQSIEIVGHTDNVGNDSSNLALSIARANSVAGFLESLGVRRHLMRIAGKGETQPISSNQNAFGRSKNRRVKITVRGMRTIIK